MATRLTTDVWDCVGAISGQLRSRFAARAEPDLGFVALATLRHLERRGPRSITELARSERVSTQAISLRVAPLLEAGLVVRSPDPSDGRRALVDVTGRGRAAVRRAQAQAKAALADAVDALTDDERAALVAALPALRRIGSHLDQEDP